MPLAAPGLVVVPGQQMPTATETVLHFFGLLFEILAAVAAGVAVVCAFGGSSAALACLAVAVGLCLQGLMLMFMGHVLRYLRTITNSLARNRAKPLGEELNE